jgi:RNA-directed DNA polymerase
VKRAGNLFERIADRDTLRQATARALRGKRGRLDARRFVERLDENLTELAARLREGTVELGRYRQFVIRDPKERVISAPGFAERVLHHAVVAVCEPHFENWLTDDSFACRPGKGRDAALRRALEFAGRHRFFLKLDIRKYFDSVPHDGLLAMLARRFKDRRLLDLFERVVRSFRGSVGRGLPIGSLTSQHFANFYLGWFDRFVKQTLRVRGYVRYMDDMVLWSDDRAVLTAALAAGERCLADELGLALKPTPYLNRTAHGMDFLGFRVHRRHLTLNRRSRLRFRRRLEALEAQRAAGLLSESELQQRGTALVAFARAADVSSWRFRQAALESVSAGGRRARTG